MKVLIVKTSSLGDVLHTLPALTDAMQQIPGIRFDWAVEESFAQVPSWHPQVDTVLPVSWRRWRKNLVKSMRQKEIQAFVKRLRHTEYDCIIDAQGLFKSAVIACLAKGLRCGADYNSAKEKVAALLYQRRLSIAPQQHAIVRMRELFAKSLGYACPQTLPDYGIAPHFSCQTTLNTIVFVHGTTRVDKEWEKSSWIALANHCVQLGYQVLIPWGNDREKARAQHIAEHAQVTVLPKSSLSELAVHLMQAKAVVAVDTGIGHLAAALAIPTVSLYGPTDPNKIGTCGKGQTHLRNSNHMSDVSVDEVGDALAALIN